MGSHMLFVRLEIYSAGGGTGSMSRTVRNNLQPTGLNCRREVSWLEAGQQKADPNQCANRNDKSDGRTREFGGR